MSGKKKLYTRRLLHRYKRKQAEEAKSEQREVSSNFKRSHDSEMGKMLKGVDLGQFD